MKAKSVSVLLVLISVLAADLASAGLLDRCRLALRTCSSRAVLTGALLAGSVGTSGCASLGGGSTNEDSYQVQMNDKIDDAESTIGSLNNSTTRFSGDVQELRLAVDNAIQWHVDIANFHINSAQSTGDAEARRLALFHLNRANVLANDTYNITIKEALPHNNWDAMGWFWNETNGGDIPFPFGKGAEDQRIINGVKVFLPLAWPYTITGTLGSLIGDGIFSWESTLTANTITPSAVLKATVADALQRLSAVPTAPLPPPPAAVPPPPANMEVLMTYDLDENAETTVDDLEWARTQPFWVPGSVSTTDEKVSEQERGKTYKEIWEEFEARVRAIPGSRLERAGVTVSPSSNRINVRATVYMPQEQLNAFVQSNRRFGGERADHLTLRTVSIARPAAVAAPFPADEGDPLSPRK